MSIFQEIKDGLATLKASAADSQKLTAQISALEINAADLTAKLATAEATIATGNSALADLTAKLTKSTEEAATLTAKITALEAEKKTVGEEAAKVVAALGVNTGSIPAQSANGGVATVAELRAKLNAETNSVEKFKICAQIKALSKK